MSYQPYHGYKSVQSYVKRAQNVSLKNFVTEYRSDIPLYSATVGCNDARDLADLWRRRINQEINASKRSDLELINLPKKISNEWDAVFVSYTEYKKTLDELETQSHQLIRESNRATSSKLSSFFETQHYGVKRNQDGQEVISRADLSHKVHQFAFDRFCGNKEQAQFNDIYMSHLKYHSESSLRYKLYLHAVSLLQEEDISDIDIHIAKLCLSGVINLFNPNLKPIFVKLLGVEFMQQMKRLRSEKVNRKGTYLDPKTIEIVDGVLALSKEDDMIDFLIDKKKEYRKQRSSQQYQIILIFEYILNLMSIWSKVKAPSELYHFRKFVTMLEYAFMDTDIVVHDGEKKSINTSKHMQWQEELFSRKQSTASTYSYGRKIDFILKDDQNNELSMGEFKQQKVSNAVILCQQTKNIRDNATIMYESLKLASPSHELDVVGIDFIGDMGYSYHLLEFEDVIVALPFSLLATPSSIDGFKEFKETLNSVYTIKNHLLDLSKVLKAGKTTESSKYTLADFFEVSDDDEPTTPTHYAVDQNVFYTPKNDRTKKSDLGEE